MIFDVDDSFLEITGLDSPDVDRSHAIEFFSRALDIRVAVRLCEAVCAAEAEQLLDFMDAYDVVGARHWIEQYFPNVRGLVLEEYEALAAATAANRALDLALADTPPWVLSEFARLDAFGSTDYPDQEHDERSNECP